jgi:hypothetical protein
MIIEVNCVACEEDLREVKSILEDTILMVLII